MSKRLIALASLAALPAFIACGPATPDPETPVSPGASASAPPSNHASGPVPTPDVGFDPVAVGLSVDGVKRICDDNLKRAEATIASIKALKGARPEILTFDATLGAFDDTVLFLADATSFPALMEVAHPDEAIRAAAKLCQPKADKFLTGLFLDADLAGVIRAYAAKNERLEGPKKRLLDEVLRDFRRNGLELKADDQAKVRALNEEMVKLGQDFEANIAQATGKMELRPAQLDGLPKDYVDRHKPNAAGKIEVTTDYPDYFPFVTYANDRRAARELYVLFTNRGGDANVQLLERLLKLRHEKAQLLGYATWADYAIEPRMAKSSKAVRDFLAQIRDALKEPAKAEMAELMKVHQKTGGKAADKLEPQDRYYLEDRVRAAKFKLDTKALAEYFESGAVLKGLLDLTSKMYGIEYKSVSANAWHADVLAFDVLAGGKRFAKIYLDLHPRADKYKHAAMFPIRSPKLLRDGQYLMPVAALECNFPKPGGAMSHEDVVTFFHEFGHVLHHIFTRSELASYAGTNTVRDFVEAPSQMFEEWAYAREVLDLFAKHKTTNEKIPNDLFNAMKAARSFGRALGTQRQVFLAALDQELHARAPGFDSTKVVEEVQSANDSFVYVKGTHFQSTFGHLIGYDAAYYSYQWALALSRDVLTRFQKEGLLSPKAAADFRREVLEKGGGIDERMLVERFLGRPTNNDAYFGYLKGKE